MSNESQKSYFTTKERFISVLAVFSARMLLRPSSMGMEADGLEVDFWVESCWGV